MDQSKKFSECLQELDKLRSAFLESEKKPNNGLLKSARELAQDQLLCLQTINEFLCKVGSHPSLNESLEADNKSIVMPERNSALNLISAAKTALEINQEMAAIKKCDSIMDKEVIERQQANLNRVSYSDLNNLEFNKYFRNTVKHYKVQPESPGQESEEFGDLTINTIASEDVLASSPY